MGDTKYCLCCNEEVPFNVVVRNERKETTCMYCGFPIDVEQTWESHKTVAEGYALIADDSRYTRQIIEDMFREKNVANNVMSFENGLALTSAFSKLLTEKKTIDLAIIDLNMPVMDGITAARLIRSLETQNHARHVPIVFFSAEKADESLKKQMDQLEPANYVNKGTDPDPDKLAARVEFLISYLLEKHGKKTT